MSKRKKWDAGRLKTLARIAIANALVVLTTYFSDWTLREVSLAYAGELFILMLVVQARVLSARRLPGETANNNRRRLLLRKLYAVLVALLIYPLFTGVTVIAVFGSLEHWTLPRESLHSLLLAWFTFLISHTLEFISGSRTGTYDELLPDAWVLAPLWRWPVMIFAFAGAAIERQSGLPPASWYFLVVLFGMAWVNTRLQVAEMDSIRAVGRNRGDKSQA